VRAGDVVGNRGREKRLHVYMEDQAFSLVPGLYSALDVVLRTTCSTVGIWFGDLAKTQTVLQIKIRTTEQTRH